MLPLGPSLRRSLPGPPQEAGPEGDEASRLARAFVTCDEAAVQAWLERGGDPDLSLPGGHTPLTFLVRNATAGNWEAVARLLLEAGASLHARDPQGTPLLTMLIRASSPDLVRLALDRGAEVNVRGADPSATSRDGNSALMWAAGRSNGMGMQRSLTCVRALLARGADPNFRNPRGYTPLMAASVIRERGAVRALLEAGALPDTRDAQGETALMKAASADAVGVMDVLLAGGADVNACNASGCTPLMNASSLEAVMLLLQRGARPDAAAQDGTTALHLQAVAGRPEQVQLLLEYGAKLEARDGQGNTALQAAVRCRSHAAAGLLLGAGAAADTANTVGAAAVHESVLAWDYFSTLDVFPALNTPALRSELVHYLAEAPREHMLAALLAGGGDPGVAGQGGVTPLMLAAAAGQEGLARLLLQAGAAVDDGDAAGRTALAYACRFGHAGLVGLLLTRDCPANTLDAHGNLPVFYAARPANMDILLALMLPLAFFMCTRPAS